MDDTLCQLFFNQPTCPAQRQYEALRVVFVEGLSQKDAAERFGYAYDAFRQLVHPFRFPFDTEGHTPDDDLDRLTRFRDKNERQRTLVWLPSFFSARTQGELAKLVVIDRLLLGNNLEQHSKHLSAQDRETARLLLKNQQSALAQRLMQAVEAAYAIRSEPMPGTLDPAWDMSDSHFQSLFPTLVLERPVGANLGEALDEEPAVVAPRKPESHPQETAWITGLFASAAYKAQKELVRRHAPEDDLVRRCLVALDSSGGIMTPAAFSKAAEVPAGRLDGLIARIQRLLNVDGYEILTMSRSENRIELNVLKLKRQLDLE